MKKTKQFIQKKGIIIILLLAIFFIFFNFTRGGFHGDDSIYSTRSIGLIDFMFANKQPTPLQLFSEFPWWANLSNHDHPPLIFWIQHIFLVFGQSAFLARLPFAFFGLLTIFLLYLLLKENINKKIALLGALFLTINSYFIWFSKITYLEGGIVFFLILTFYFFIKFLSSLETNYSQEKNKIIPSILSSQNRNWFYFGLSLGLLLITKYTTLFVLPAIFFYLLIKERKIFQRKELYLAVLVIFFTISPVLIYNLMMYKTLGHFDLQWAGVLGQNSPWKLNRTITTNYWGNLMAILQILGNSLSFVYLGFFLLSLFYFFLQKIKDLFQRKKQKLNNYQRILSVSLYLLFFLFVFFIGLVIPEIRFLDIFTPLMAIVMVLACFSIFSYFQGRIKRLFGFIIFIFVAFQLFFVFNTHILSKPIGQDGVLYAKNRNIDYGIESLDIYLNKLLQGKNVVNRVDFYREIKRKKQGLKKYKLENSFKYSAGEKFYPIFVWDPNINWFSGIWLFERRRFYDNLPFFSAQEFIQLTKNKGGVGSFYFIKATDNASLTTLKYRTDFSDKFEKQLIEEGAMVDNIKKNNGEIVFKIYKK